MVYEYVIVGVHCMDLDVFLTESIIDVGIAQVDSNLRDILILYYDSCLTLYYLFLLLKFKKLIY